LKNKKNFPIVLLLILAAIFSCSDDDTSNIITISGLYSRAYNLHSSLVPSSGANAKFYVSFSVSTKENISQIYIPVPDKSGYRWTLYYPENSVDISDGNRFSGYFYSSDHLQSLKNGTYTIIVETKDKTTITANFVIKSLTGNVDNYSYCPEYVATTPVNSLLELTHIANASISGDQLSVDIGFFTGYAKSFYILCYDSFTNNIGNLDQTNITIGQSSTTNSYTFTIPGTISPGTVNYIYIRAANTIDLDQAWCRSSSDLVSVSHP